ncbi:MAG: Gfo/Idh/MocA family oxidoreductase [Chloroflexi bacterium]|nr:Gfo/Idh/MocA family oxidoreductase [Chloroflexota bacterium]
MEHFRIGVVGVHRGAGFVNQFAVLPDAEITALCDLRPEILSELAAPLNVPDRNLFTNYEEFLQAPIDIVVISTPMPYHADQVIAALESGRHVLSEVTAATTVEDCARIVEAVKRTGQTYMMAENCCYFHFIREWKGWVDQGRIGDIFYAESEYIHGLHDMIIDPETGRKSWRANRPPIYYCTHSLGPLLYLMDDRVVKACGAHSGYSIMPEDTGPGALNMEVGLFKTQRGAVIKILRSSVAYREPPMHYYSLYGAKGFVETDRTGGRGGDKGKLFIEGAMEVYEEIACPHADPNAAADQLKGGHGTAEYYLVREFLDALKEGIRPPIDVVRAMDFTLPGICAHESAMNDSKWVDVPLFEW